MGLVVIYTKSSLHHSGGMKESLSGFKFNLSEVTPFQDSVGIGAEPFLTYMCFETKVGRSEPNIKKKLPDCEIYRTASCSKRENLGTFKTRLH